MLYQLEVKPLRIEILQRYLQPFSLPCIIMLMDQPKRLFVQLFILA